jgi:predicted secreted protein
VPPRGSVTFTASGGSETGFGWSLATNASGGSINSATGLYTAGATGDVTDAVRVTDALGNNATRNVRVTASISISPATTSVAPKGNVTFTASGGSRTGYSWSLRNNVSGGSINAETGLYTAGGTASVTDLVQVTDSLGNASTAEVSVAAVRQAQTGGGGCAIGDSSAMSFAALIFFLTQRSRQRRHNDADLA